MTDDTLIALAKAAGLAPDWTDAFGVPHTVPADTLVAVLNALGYPAGNPRDIADSHKRIEAQRHKPAAMIVARAGQPIAVGEAQRAVVHLAGGGEHALDIANGTAVVPEAIGYHRIELDGELRDLAIVPARCFAPADVAPDRRLSAIAVQLYSLRGGHTAGFGDLSALADFAARAAANGIDAVAVSPTHALLPGAIGPYSPSTRYFYDPLYADVSLAGGTPAADDGSAIVDWPRASREKFAALENAYRAFREHPSEEFAAFRSQGGERLFNHALFETLDEHFRKQGITRWPDWPAAFRHPHGAGVVTFAREHKDAVTYHVFLQWLTAKSVHGAQRVAREAGMAIGIISDLAVGMDPSGSHAWSAHEELLRDVHIGAPPDLINTLGQNWGLTALSPSTFREHGYGAFIATLRAAMRYAGGVRIDHAMGVERLWLVPKGARATDGVYLHYPVHDLLNLIALESQLHSAIVIGEDLGTVPNDFRDALAATGVMGMQVLWFQREGRALMPPAHWSAQSSALTTTHDLPTVAGWWRGHDLDWFDRLGRKTDRHARASDRRELWSAFRAAGSTGGTEPLPDNTAPVVEAAMDFIGRTPCDLAIVPAEDILGLAEQPNIPGTVDEHPNWRRRLPAGDVFAAPDARRNLAALRRARAANHLK